MSHSRCVTESRHGDGLGWQTVSFTSIPMKSLLVLILLLSQSWAFVNSNAIGNKRRVQIFLAETRQPWELGRFVQQSSKFVNLNPFQSTSAVKIEPGDILWEPAANQFQFAPLDDVVMGGVSSSTFDNTSGKWTGVVTDANNGGFVGVRSFPNFEWDMQGCKGIEMKIKGGAGMRYKVVLRDTSDFNGVAWTTSVDIGSASNPLMQLFENGEDTTTVRIPFANQIPTKFARTVQDASFSAANIVGIQLTYSKFEYDGDLNPKFSLGDIDLQIQEIKAY